MRCAAEVGVLWVLVGRGGGADPSMCAPSPPAGTRSHPNDFGGNGTENPDPMEYKSLQWFGATVRAHNASILVWDGGGGG